MTLVTLHHTLCRVTRNMIEAGGLHVYNLTTCLCLWYCIYWSTIVSSSPSDDTIASYMIVCLIWNWYQVSRDWSMFFCVQIQDSQVILNIAKFKWSSWPPNTLRLGSTQTAEGATRYSASPESQQQRDNHLRTVNIQCIPTRHTGLAHNIIAQLAGATIANLCTLCHMVI